MTPSDKLREIVDKTFPLFGSRLDEWRKVERDRLLSDLTALISEHYTANEEVDKMVSERLREELIAFEKFATKQKWTLRAINPPEFYVDEYLKSREK